MSLAIAKDRSINAKLGDAATTHAAQLSCPSSCVFFDGGGCYAETGRQGKFVTEPLNLAAAADEDATSLDVALDEAEAIAALPGGGRPLRLHTVGDCKGDTEARIVSGAAERYMAGGGGPVWTYTHAWRETARESWGTVSVLASCETAEDVALARSRGYATSVVVEEFEADRLYQELPNDPRPAVLQRGITGGVVNGRGGGAPVTSAPKILPCPAQTRDRSCSSCRLCFNDTRLREDGITIGFELHGIPYAVRQARLALRRPNDPRRRDTVETQLRELLDERPDLTAREAATELVMNETYAGQLLRHLRGHAKHPSVLRRERYDRAKEAA